MTGETRTGHLKENLATEAGPLSSLEACSGPGTAGDHGWGGGAQGPVQMKAAQTPALRAWPPDSPGSPLGSICASLFLRRKRGRQVSLVSTALPAWPPAEGLRGQASREGV